MKMELSYELIKEAHSLSMEAHKHTHQHYTTNTKKHGFASSSGAAIIFVFPGLWEPKDWFNGCVFGETDVDPTLFPSLRLIGQNKLAKVNEAFFKRFQKLLKETAFQEEVETAVNDKKEILFTGHSSGGAIASLATIWILEKYRRNEKAQIPIGCVTFGCPLVGDQIVSHALRREKWAYHFTHFVMEFDIVPRMMLAPHSSIQEQLPHILSFFQQKVNPTSVNKTSKIRNPLKIRKRTIDQDLDHSIKDHQVDFFENVLMSASTVASHAANDLMEPTGFLMEKLSADFVKVSPYRPCGTYIFCTQSEIQDPETARPQLVVENPKAILQLLFYFCQLSSEDQNNLDNFALNSLKSNFSYEEELIKNGFQSQKMVNLNDLNGDLLTRNGSPGNTVRASNKALSELSTKGRLCLVAVEEAEKRKKENEKRIDASMTKVVGSEKKNIEDLLRQICEYKEKHAEGQMGCYDAFKLQDDPEDDVKANINRLELMTIWDEIVEMIMREELPDEFEGRKEWVEIGTVFRCLVEPLDIANYYRHSKGGGYFRYRPKRYKFTQHWYEHANRVEFKEISESSFMAEVEELMKEVEEPRNKKKVEDVERQVLKWISEEILGKEESTSSKWWRRLPLYPRDVLLEESTFSKWWRRLPHDHRTHSVLKETFIQL